LLLWTIYWLLLLLWTIYWLLRLRLLLRLLLWVVRCGRGSGSTVAAR
jgi:hypothetical protein